MAMSLGMGGGRPSGYEQVGSDPNLSEFKLRQLLSRTGQHGELARQFMSATEGEYPGSGMGAWAEPGMQDVFQKQLGGGMSPSEEAAATSRIRHGFGAAVRGAAGSGYRPGEAGIRTAGTLPGLGGSLVDLEARRAELRRGSLRDAGQTAGTVLPIAAEADRGRRDAFGETLGYLRGGEMPRLRPIRGLRSTQSSHTSSI